MTLQVLQDTILNNIRKMIMGAPSPTNEYLLDENETLILKAMGIKAQKGIDNSLHKVHSKPSSPNIYIPPPQYFIELSFDGSSKENLGKAGIGGILRDANSNPLHFFAQSCGIAMNNMMEFMALEIGLQIVVKKGYKPIQVHGDS